MSKLLNSENLQAPISLRFLKKALSSGALMAIAVSPMPAAAAGKLDNNKISSPGLVVVHDNTIKDYLSEHSDHPLNLTKSYVLPDGQSWSNYDEQQRQIFTWGFHAKVPAGPAGDRFIEWVKATHPGQHIIVTDPRPEVIEFKAHYTITNSVLSFQLNAAPSSQVNPCQDKPIYPNATLTQHAGFVTQATIGHVPSLPLKDGARGYSDLMRFDRSVQGRVDLGATVAADGKNHVEAVAPVEIKVSRQIMLKKDASNLATYTTCIKQTYWEPGCLVVEGVPDRENGRAGWAQIRFTNNRYDCQQITGSSQQVGGASPPEPNRTVSPLPQLANNTVSPDLVVSTLPTLIDAPLGSPVPPPDYQLFPEGPGTGSQIYPITPSDNIPGITWLPWLPIKPPPGRGTPGSPPSGGGGSPPPPPNSGSPPHGGGSPPPGGGGFPFGGGGFPGCHPGGTTPISAAPEPATWVQMIFGVALMGGLLRRNKQAPAP
jgi:hypothetical protein